MPTDAKHVLTIEKKSLRKLNPAKVAAQVSYIAGRVKDGGRGDKWNCEFEAQEVRFRNDEYTYRYDLTLTHKSQRDREQGVIDQEFHSITKVIADAGRGEKWKLIEVDESRGAAATITAPPKNTGESGSDTGGEVDYAPCVIPPDWRSNFAHIYDRDAQIDVIYSYVRAAIESNFACRFHAALVGEPAGGKTETARAFKRMLGEAAVFEMSATETTMAGAIKALDERRREHMVPRVLIIEEIEKADFKQYPWLLGVLDPRAEIRKINAKQKIHMQAKMLCIATINNYGLFRRALEGALASRFAEPIFFPRPEEDTLRKILERDVAKVGGNPKWIKPAIEYARKHKISDPRHMLAVCLAGRDELTSGKYQDKLAKTRIPDDYYKA